MGPEAILLSVRQSGKEGGSCSPAPTAPTTSRSAPCVALLVSAGVDIDQAEGDGAGQLLFDEEPVEDPRGQLPMAPHS